MKNPYLDKVGFLILFSVLLSCTKSQIRPNIVTIQDGQRNTDIANGSPSMAVSHKTETQCYIEGSGNMRSTNSTNITVACIFQMNQIKIYHDDNASSNKKMWDMFNSITSLTASHWNLTGIPNMCANNISAEIENLSLASNKIKDCQFNCYFKNIRILNLQHNQISKLKHEFFQNISSVIDVNLSYNKIVNVSKEAFHFLHNLRYLNLSHNSIIVLDAWFMHLKKLDSLDLSFNSLNSIINTYRIESFDPSNDGFLLNLDNNNFTTLSVEMFYNFFNVNTVPQLAMVIYAHQYLFNVRISFQHNPLLCDCKMSSLLELEPVIMRVWKPRIYNTSGYLSCYNPPQLRGRPLAELNKEDLICDFTGTSNCSSGCQCVQRSKHSLLDVMCTRSDRTSFPKNIPDLEGHLRLDLSHNKITKITNEFSLKNLTELNLSYNAFQVLNAKMLQSLKGCMVVKIHLNNNQIEWIDKDTLDVLTTLSQLMHLALSENPLVCNCSSYWMKEWVANNVYISQSDKENIVCASQSTWGNIRILDMPNENDKQYTSQCKLQPTNVPDHLQPHYLAIITIFPTIILTCMGIVLGYKLKLYLERRHSSNNENTIIIHEMEVSEYPNTPSEDLNCNENTLQSAEAAPPEPDPGHIASHYHYDGFICYAGEDWEWVKQNVIDLLEGTRVCVENLFKSYHIYNHARDFPLGEAITYSIAKGIEKSQRILFLISTNFIKSDWCMYEFRTALTYRYTNRHAENKIILLILDDVDITKTERDLRLYIDTYTCLFTNDKLFEEKLIKNMPSLTVKEACKAVERHKLSKDDVDS